MIQNDIQLNIPQLIAAIAPQKFLYLKWGRGTGKSTFFGYRINKMIREMPRASFFLVGETYQQILTRTLPSTIQGLEMFGLKRDQHYFIGKKAPASWNWDLPYQAPVDFSYYIHFYTGAGFHLVPLDSQQSGGRGLNTDGGIGDEAQGFSQDKFFASVLATNRGNIDRFGNSQLHHSVALAFTYPWLEKGKWLLDMKKEAIENPNKMLYLEASSYHNRHNLGEDWFSDNRRQMTKLMYSVEIDNELPDQIEGGFYSSFNSKYHTYNNFNNSYLETLNYDLIRAQELTCKQDADIVPNYPLNIAFDYGAKINCAVIEQETLNESRILSAMYVKSPKLITDLVDKICNYYLFHHTKMVNYYYDHTAIHTDAARSQSYSEIIIERFQYHKWTVNPIYIGQAMEHHIKYNFLNVLFKETEHVLPRVRMNSENSKYLIISIQQAGLIDAKGKISKDKGPEKTSSKQEETTHFSDAFDTLMIGKYAAKLSYLGMWV